MKSNASAAIDGFSVVLAGVWNAAIFSPDWVSNGRLTVSDNLGFELNVENLALPPRLTFDGIRLHVLPTRLELTTTDLTEELLEKLTATAVKVLRELPHTPLQGVGVNARYKVPEPEPSLLELFSLRDQNPISDLGAVLETTTIARRLEFEGLELNVTLRRRLTEPVRIDSNFSLHRPASGDAVTFLSRGFASFRSIGERFVGQAYDLEFLED
jgi:hypothetical protein